MDFIKELNAVIAEKEGALVNPKRRELIKAAVRNKDLRAIYEMNVHPLLCRMGYMALWGRISTPDYRAALDGAVPVEY